MPAGKVTVKKHPDTQRPKRWWVYFQNAEGKRQSKFFETRAEAEVYAESLNIQLKNFGLKALTLSDVARHDAQRALDILVPYGKTLKEAATFYVKHLEKEKSCPVEDLLDNFLTEKEGQSVSPRHLEDLRSRISRFAEHFKGKPIGAIESEQIADWLRGLPGSPHTRQNARRVLHNFFGYAVRRKMAQTNPVTIIPSFRIPDHEILIFTPDEIRSLLNYAAPAIVPYLALGAFAGLRSAELLKLRWEAIEFHTGNVRIGSDIAKTRSKRLIPLADNLRAWLTPYAQPHGLILAEHEQWKLRRYLHEACERAGIKWKNNALRHSYATYRMAVMGDAAKTSLEMGNSPNIVFKHYRELVISEQAISYWSVIPRPNLIEAIKAA